MNTITKLNSKFGYAIVILTFYTISGSFGGDFFRIDYTFLQGYSLAQKKSLSIVKGYRVPRSGGLYIIFRILSSILMGGGILIIMGSVVGFSAVIIKSAPDLFDVSRYPAPMYYGFMISLILPWLIASMVSALFGFIISSTGIILYFVTTQPPPRDQIRDVIEE